MKCPICGKQTLPGAKLCSPCRAALKRAKDDSIWEMPPGQGARPSAAGAAPLAPVGPTRWVLGSRLAGWRGAGVGVAALFVAAGVFATVRLVHVDPPERARVEQTRPTVPVAAPVAQPPSPEIPQVLVLPKVALETPAHAPPGMPAVDDEAPPSRPERAPRGPRSTRVVQETQPMVFAPAAEAPPPPLAQPLAAERPAPARPVDPWQGMDESLSRCAGQDLFGRLGCQHRVRSTYCEGNWGRVPQCPAGISNDHGQ